MLKRSKNKLSLNFHLDRFTQISESHCGPAVVQMLLSVYGIDVSQEDVALAGGAAELIELNGMRVDQLAQAVQVLAPQMQFWVKDYASLEDLIAVVEDHEVPAGVEWQGLFYEEGEEEPESEDNDFGHYSVVTGLDPEKEQVVIADPYKDYVAQDRIFGFDFFLQRWWDTNEVLDPDTGRPHLVEDTRTFFIILPQEDEFPIGLGMKKA